MALSSAASTWPSSSLIPKLRTLVGSFAPDAGNAPVAVRGKGFTVTRTGAGTYRVQLLHRYPGLVSVHVSEQVAAANGFRAQAGAFDADALQLTIYTLNGAGAATDFATATGRVNFTLQLNGSTLGG